MTNDQWLATHLPTGVTVEAALTAIQTAAFGDAAMPNAIQVAAKCAFWLTWGPPTAPPPAGPRTFGRGYSQVTAAHCTFLGVSPSTDDEWGLLAEELDHSGL